MEIKKELTLKEEIENKIKFNPFEQNAILGCNIYIEDEKEFSEDVIESLNEYKELVKIYVFKSQKINEVLCKTIWKELNSLEIEESKYIKIMDCLDKIINENKNEVFGDFNK